MKKLTLSWLHLTFSAIDTSRLLLACLSVLFGSAFTRSFGLPTFWPDILKLLIWVSLLLAGFDCLNTAMDGAWPDELSLEANPALPVKRLHELARNYMILFALALMSVSAMALFQLFSRLPWQGLPPILAVGIYLVFGLPLWLRGWERLAVVTEPAFALATSFLLPAFVFSLSRDTMKGELLRLSFPLFLLLLAWSLSRGLEKKLRGAKPEASCLAVWLAAPDCLSLTATLLAISALLIVFSGALLPFPLRLGLVMLNGSAIFLLMRSLTRREPYWTTASILISTIPHIYLLALLAALW